MIIILFIYLFFKFWFNNLYRYVDLASVLLVSFCILAIVWLFAIRLAPLPQENNASILDPVRTTKTSLVVLTDTSTNTRRDLFKQQKNLKCCSSAKGYAGRRTVTLVYACINVCGWWSQKKLLFLQFAALDSLNLPRIELFNSVYYQFSNSISASEAAIQIPKQLHFTLSAVISANTCFRMLKCVMCSSKIREEQGRT